MEEFTKFNASIPITKDGIMTQQLQNFILKVINNFVETGEIMSAIEDKIDIVDGVVDGIADDLSTVDGNVDSILEDTGTTLPNTLTTIEGKVDTVDTVADNIYSELGSGSGIPGTFKSVQRGSITLSGQASNTATIAAVTTSKARVRFLGSTSDADSTVLNLRIVLTNSTTVTAYRGAGAGGGDISIASYEVEEVY